MSNHHLHAAFAYLFDVGKDILFAGIDQMTKVIACQIGNATDATADSDKAELWGPPGIWSIPAAPTAGASSCQAIAIKRSDRDIIIATRDNRRATIYGNLKSGETCVGANTGQARALFKANGDSWFITNVGNTPSGQTCAWHQGSDGSFAFQGLAAFISADASGNITIGNNAASIKISAAGRVDIVGQIVNAQASGVAQISGTLSTCVGPRALPTPANACAYSSVGPANLVSANVFISPT